MDKKELRNQLSDYYSTSTGYLAGLQEKGPTYFRHYMEMVSNLAKEESMILDLGCGPGISTRLLKSRFGNTFGADLSFLFVQSDGDGDKIVCDAHDLPVSDNSLDLIASFEFIEHICDAEKVLDEMVRTVKPDGKILIMSPNLYSPLIPVKALLSYLHGQKRSSPWTSTFFSIFSRFFYNLSMIVVRKADPNPRFRYRTPDLSPWADQGGDFDSVFMANPLDISKYLRRRGCRILSTSIGQSRAGKLISRYLPSFATGMVIIAEKRGEGVQNKMKSRIDGRSHR
ncbi:MAG TPA: class I SAM-dependent methyltransferase [bacterium]|nr:class I SAM-dependent methyltransferase [bacterium]